MPDRARPKNSRGANRASPSEEERGDRDPAQGVVRAFSFFKGPLPKDPKHILDALRYFSISRVATAFTPAA